MTKYRKRWKGDLPCPARTGGVHEYVTVDAAIEGHGSVDTVAIMECQHCFGLRREERHEIEVD